MERLQKIIAAAGIASRRKAEELILAGKVRVNGHTVKELGFKADAASDTIVVNNKPLVKPALITYLLNKPRGYVCSAARQRDEKIVLDLLPPFPRVNPVGRLDKESEGLLLLTNDGALAEKLTHPRFTHKKTYVVECSWDKDAEQLPLAQLTARFAAGVRLKDGLLTVDDIVVKPLAPGRLSITITIHEGRNHILRRACSTFGLTVRKLRRVAVGKLVLNRLAPGEYRTLTSAEVSLLSQK